MSIPATWTTHKYKPVVHRDNCQKLYSGAGSWVFDQCCQLHGRHLWKPGLRHFFSASSLMWLTCMKEGRHCLTSIWLSDQGPKCCLYAVNTAVYTVIVIFRFGKVLCSNSLLFEAWEAVGCCLKQSTFRWPYRREGLRLRRLPCSNSLLFEAWKA